MTSHAMASAFERSAQALRPAEDMLGSEWAKKNFRLIDDGSNERFRPWKFQIGILDAMFDPLLERVSIIKSARTGYTKSLVSTIGSYAANDPSAIMLMMPTDDDTRGIVVDEIDPAFRDIPALRGLMITGRMDGRNTLTSRKMHGGGSLKVISARSPRNLRRHTVRVLIGDEIDGMVVTKEGDPIVIAEKRTLSKSDRKIIFGSTPTDEETSIITGMYENSDKRVFEVPCPHCQTKFEILWEHVDWPKGKPEEAVIYPPCCGAKVEEHHKLAMVEAGEWRITAPHVKGHAGFRINALISLFENVGWGKLAQEYELALKGGPTKMQVFHNTVLGKTWSKSINYVGEKTLMERVESFGIHWSHEKDCWREDIPADVAFITCGVDVQIDRLECTLIGWDGIQRYILGHHIIMGPTNLETTWDECDAFLSTRWKHPLGGSIGIEAATIDAGDGNRTQYVYDFTSSRLDRKIVAIKGVDGARPIIASSRSKNSKFKGAFFFNIGVDQVKTDVLTMLSETRVNDQGEKTPQAFRFSDSLTEEWFTQITSERRILEYVAGKPVIKFRRIENRDAEGLDCTVYAIAAKHLCKFDYEKRRLELTGEPKKRKRPDFGAMAKTLNG